MNAHSNKRKYNLHWTNVNLVEPSENKLLLANCSGCVSSGQFLSIMGPSGAGKSSLLSILTARLSANNSKLGLSGEVLLNGSTFNLSKFSKISAYVQQDDLLFETFLFQARLNLWKASFQEQSQKCEEILKKLNLLQCGDTVIGNSQFKKSISGGQKKRVSIGVQLISNPQILVFDEPTSGLDSHNALIIVKLLAKLAKDEKKLIITTIHQPSTLIFRSMDQLYLLKSGQCIYNGPADQIVGYMQNLQIKVDYRMNPADFFMLEISAMKALTGYQTPFNASNFKQNKIQSKMSINQIESQLSQVPQIQEIQSVPFSYQFKPLCQRAFKNFYRLPSNQLNKLVTAIMIPAMLGILYFKIADDAPSVLQQRYLTDLISFMFISLYFVFAMNIYDTIMIFPIQKYLVFKEAGANLYSITAYYISRLIAEILGCLVPALVCAVVMYFCATFELTFSHFFVFVGLFLIMALEGYFFGMFFGVLCKDQQTAINLQPMVLIPIIVFGGLAVNINDIPGYIRWLQYFSPLRHSFLILFQDQMNSEKFQQFQPYNLPKQLGIDGDSTAALGYLLGLFGLYFVLSIVLLVYQMKKRE